MTQRVGLMAGLAACRAQQPLEAAASDVANSAVIAALENLCIERLYLFHMTTICLRDRRSRHDQLVADRIVVLGELAVLDARSHQILADPRVACGQDKRPRRESKSAERTNQEPYDLRCQYRSPYCAEISLSPSSLSPLIR